MSKEDNKEKEYKILNNSLKYFNLFDFCFSLFLYCAFNFSDNIIKLSDKLAITSFSFYFSSDFINGFTFMNIFFSLLFIS